MEKFLKTISEFFKQHPQNILESLIATQVPCGIFVPTSDCLGVANNLMSKNLNQRGGGYQRSICDGI